MRQKLIKFNHPKIKEILQEMELKQTLEYALMQLSGAKEVLSYLAENHQDDAILHFLALGLPKREAVWWAYLCACEAEDESTCESTQQALKHTHDWVHDQTDDARRAAGVMAESLELYTPASWAAMAAFWSGDNIASIGKPKVEPDEFMAGQAVYNAIILVAEQQGGSKQAIKNYIRRGLHIAMGGNGKVNVPIASEKVEIK